MGEIFLEHEALMVIELSVEKIEVNFEDCHEKDQYPIEKLVSRKKYIKFISITSHYIIIEKKKSLFLWKTLTLLNSIFLSIKIAN